MKRAAAILLIAAGHFALSIGVFLASFGASMARVDHGGPPSVGEWVLEAATEILLFPLSALKPLLPGRWFPGLWGYIPFAANSLAWGASIYWLLGFLRRRRAASQARR